MQILFPFNLLKKYSLTLNTKFSPDLALFPYNNQVDPVFSSTNALTRIFLNYFSIFETSQGFSFFIKNNFPFYAQFFQMD